VCEQYGDENYDGTYDRPQYGAGYGCVYKWGEYYTMYGRSLCWEYKCIHVGGLKLWNALAGHLTTTPEKGGLLGKVVGSLRSRGGSGRFWMAVSRGSMGTVPIEGTWAAMIVGRRRAATATGRRRMVNCIMIFLSRDF
jgi:hypothetical protein